MEDNEQRGVNITPDDIEASGVTPPAGRRRPWWARLLKWLCITLVVLVVLIAAAVSLLVWTLTPERLTPLVEKYASEYLDADVTVGRVELTYWSSWPRLEVQVDSLKVVSRALDGMPAELRDRLPAGSDTLLTLRQFRGGVHILNLIAGRIDLYDVLIDGPRANLVNAGGRYANYDILPPSEAAPDTTAFEIPEFSIDRFRFINAGPVSYTSLPDSLRVVLHLHDIDIPGLTLPRYALTFECEAQSAMTKVYDIDRIDIGFDGKIAWSKDRPTNIGLHDMTIGIGADDDLRLDITADVTVEDTTVINSLTIKADDVDLTRLLTHLPASMARYLKPLRTDMRLNLAACLTRPYVVGDSLAIPSVHVDLEIPACRLKYQDADFRKFMLKASAEIDGADLDRSTLHLDRMLILGRAMDMDVRGDFSSLLSDPRIDASIAGQMRFDALPRVLTRVIPYDISGRIATRSRVRMRMSQLTAARFHRVFADGIVHLYDFEAVTPDSSLVAYIRDARLDFGTNRRIVIDNERLQASVDSLLRVSLTVDTLHLSMPDLDVAVQDFTAGVGSLNRAASVDTAAINPFGGGIKMGRLRMVAFSDTDSVRLRMRELQCRAVLSRYQGDRRNPRLDLNVSARRISVGDLLNRLSFTSPAFTLTANIKPRPAIGRRKQAMLDSVAASNPALSADSVAVIVTRLMAERRSRRVAADSIAASEARAAGEEYIDMELDEGFKKLLRRWDIRGHLTAERGRLATPYLPLKNRFRNIDFEFNTDSLNLHNLRYEMGQSDFTLSGVVSNMRRALASRRRIRQPLKIELDVRSDTINVNELTQALLAGSAMANDSTLAARVREADEDADIDYKMSDDTVTGPLIIPRNIDAKLSVRSAKTLYSDLVFDDFTGQVLAYDGSVSLRQLSATTDMGAIDMSALYSAPDKDDMKFGLGMKVHNFKLDRLTRLIPAIDSLMPMMRNFAGSVNADLALTTNLYDNMDLNLASLTALLKIDGDSLVLMDPETFRIASKWLFFKNKERNMIDHLSAEIAIENSMLSLYPFMFNIDRYRLGVMGHNDLDMNLDYHVSVLKSPLPFKFGINITGPVDNMKYRLGGAKIKENMVVERVQVADTVRVNLVEQFDRLFRRGAKAASVGRISFDAPVSPDDIPDSGATGTGSLPSEAAVPKETDPAPASTIDLLRQAINAIPTAQ